MRSRYVVLSFKSDSPSLTLWQAAAVADAFEAERQFLLVSTKAKKPDMSAPVYMETLKDIQQEMTRVDIVREKNRASPQKDHLAMVADGVSALAWITIEPKPAEYVAELFGGAQMYGNKVLKEYKDKYGLTPCFRVAKAFR